MLLSLLLFIENIPAAQAQCDFAARQLPWPKPINFEQIKLIGNLLRNGPLGH